MAAKDKPITEDPEYVWTGCDCGEDHECGIE